MAIYTIKYSEVYSKEYEIEADDKEQAKEILVDMLYSGEIDPPCECDDSYSEIISEEETINVIVGDSMTRKKVTVPISSSPIEVLTMSGVLLNRRTTVTLQGIVLPRDSLFETFEDINVHGEVYLLTNVPMKNF